MKELRDSQYTYYQFTVEPDDIYVSRSGSEFGYKNNKLSLIDDLSYPLFNQAGYEIKDEDALKEYLGG